MGPAALLDYNRERLRGLVLEEGGATSHVAIVARALGIPAVSEVENITALVEQGDAMIVDGQTGEIQIRPPPDVENVYKEKARLRARRQEQYRSLRDQPAVTATASPSTSRSMPVCSSTCRISRRRARRASGFSAPSCSSWWRRACRPRPSSRNSMAPCSTA